MLLVFARQWWVAARRDILPARHGGDPEQPAPGLPPIRTLRRVRCRLDVRIGGRMHDSAVKAQCCREFAVIPPYCRCDVQSYYMDVGASFN
uniref:Bifunctional inhibitor/plant lipid transfer protein/seed storage helical domain-containing protein n=1 Tax=Leersia perrieri TaxID=77586 RepID=A0A0D9WWU8_9ORYZ